MDFTEQHAASEVQLLAALGENIDGRPKVVSIVRADWNRVPESTESLHEA